MNNNITNEVNRKRSLTDPYDNMQYQNSFLLKEINLKLVDLVNKIDKFENTCLSLNTNLIQQNIKMSEIVNGKLEEPQFEQEKIESNKEKQLYYYNINDLVIVHGPGTFDNKSELSKYGNWNSNNKTWDLIISNDILLEKFPSIIFKNKENNQMLIDN
tara:strand:+ start:558 stop:1031 length:474 start_codon:yes stop_codon:yes gene_type:complete